MKLQIVRMKDDRKGRFKGYLSYRTDRTCEEEILYLNPVLLLEEVADMCDRNAESRNNHAFVGTHRILATMLFKQYGRGKATDLIVDIARHGGLDAMTGHYARELGNSPTVYEELGIKRPWSKWKLPETKKQQ